VKFEPALDKPALMETIWQAYGYPVSALTFVPEGEVGCHYLAECEDGKRYFLTLLLNNRLARLNTGRLDFALRLERTLYDRGLFRSLAVPQRTRTGGLHAEFQGQPLIVHDYIEGESLEGTWPYPSKVLIQLGKLAAQLHRATPSLDMDVPFVEHFDLPFEAALRECLVKLESVNAHSRPGQQALSDLLLTQRETLLDLLARLHELAAAARALRPPLVLVHTDMTPNNILRTPKGELFIVDWGGAMLAPAEHDLFLFFGEGFMTLLKEYCRMSVNLCLHPEIFSFYFYCRNLDDTTDILIRILHENITDEEDRHDLDLLREDCLSGWPYLESSIEIVTEQLQAIATG
jgi:thiamine kinase-like enzyme